MAYIYTLKMSFIETLNQIISLLMKTFTLNLLISALLVRMQYVTYLLADDPGTYRWVALEMIKRKSYGRVLCLSYGKC